MASGVYVRAVKPDGRIAVVDVMELDDESFRRFVLMHLVKASMVVAVVDDMREAAKEPLKTRR